MPLLIILVFIAFFIILTLIKRNQGGEDALERKLAKYDEENQRILRNLYVPYGKEGKTTEIDSVMLRKSGIFVFESKNYTGWIFGNSRNKYWTESFYSQRYQEVEKHSFYNPIMQNRTHISVLRKFLNEPSIPMFNIVVFSNLCTFKDVTVLDDAYVIKMRDVNEAVSRIENLYAKSGIEINENRMKEIYRKLLPCTNPSTEVVRRHLMDVKNKKERY